MTAAKPHHLTARKLLLEHLDLNPGRTVGTDLDPAEVGIVGDTAHAAGGDSYHLGKDQIRARGDRARYSVDESPRDQAGLDNYASALDIGYFKVTTARGTFDLYDFNTWLTALCRAGDPDTGDLREVIYSLDGKTVRRWDRLGRRTSGDNTHTWHTHLSEHRDATGQRMIRLATRWLQHIGLLPGEDDVTKTEFMTWMTEWAKGAAGREALARAVLTSDGIIPAPAGSVNADKTPNTHWALASYTQHTYNAAVTTRGYTDTALKTLSGQPAAVAQAVIAALPPNPADITPAMLETAILAAIRRLGTTATA